MPIIITALTITKARTSQHTIFLISPRATFCAIILYLEGHFNDSLDIDNKNPSAHNGLASMYIIQGNYDDAIKELEIAVGLQPKYLFAYHDLALANYLKTSSICFC